MIAIVSDSHIPSRKEEMPERFWEKVEEAEITVHAGDFDSKETYNAFEEYSNEFHAVKGNTDFFEAELPNSDTFQAGGLKIGVYHGTGITPRAHKPTLRKIAEDLDVELLIHGHSHHVMVENGEKVLLNPGSCTGASGGTAQASNPTMMIMHPEKFVVDVLEQTDQGLETESHELHR